LNDYLFSFFNEPTDSFVYYFTKLFLAHLLSDYFLQGRSWSFKKSTKSSVLYVHILITCVVVSVLVPHWQIIVFVTVTHFLIDYLKISFGKGSIFWFLVDQFLHLFVLFISACLLVFYNPILLEDKLQIPYFVTTTLFILLSSPLAAVLGILASRWQNQVTNDHFEQIKLYKTGFNIGIAERLIGLLFFVFGFGTFFWIVFLPKYLFLKNKASKNLIFQGILTLQNIAVLLLLTFLFKTQLLYF
jgi:Protein of unknown function (DUF3307)